MPKLFEMRQDLAEAITEAKAAEGDKNMSAVLRSVCIERANEKISAIRAQIKTIESQNTLRPSQIIPGFDGTPSQPATTIREAMKYASPAEVEGINSFARYVGGDVSALADLTPGGDAGVIIPTIIAGVVQRNYAQFAPVVGVARLWQTQFGEPELFPVISDSEAGEILAPAAATGADATVSGDTPPTDLTGPLMKSYKFSSKPVFVPRETVTDSTLNVLDELLSALLARIIRLQNLKYTKGTGSAEPTGFLHDATAFNITASTALDLDVALDLVYSVPALYRPNGVYMCSDTTAKYLRKLKTGVSGDKRSLWHEFQDGSKTDGTPATLHGYPVIINNDMDSVAADGTFTGVNPLAFGDYSRFVVRQAENGKPYIYRYTVPAKDGGAVIAFQRSDSKLLVSTAISKLAYGS
jgi:HK97 family phage major capsid protein